MEKSPAFQWYPKDFDTDENVILMTLEEIGAYVKLMNSEWLHKGLPMEDENLAIISRLGEKWFTGSGEKIKKCFKKKGKRLIHPRLEKERKKQQEWRLKSSNGGKKSASVRKESKKEPTTLAPPLGEKVNQSPTLLSSSSSPSSTSIKDLNTISSKEKLFNERYWSIYPSRSGRKIGKAEALKKFLMIKDEELPLLLTAVINLSKSDQMPKDFHRFIKDSKGEPWREWVEVAIPEGSKSVDKYRRVAEKLSRSDQKF